MQKGLMIAHVQVMSISLNPHGSLTCPTLQFFSVLIVAERHITFSFSLCLMAVILRLTAPAQLSCRIVGHC